MSYISVSLFVAALFAYTNGQFGVPPPASSWSFGPRGKLINFAAPGMDLQKICYMITAAYTPGQLSDAMGSAMKYFAHKKIPTRQASKMGSGMSCLYDWAIAMKDPGAAGNLFGDFYDTVIEAPQMRGYFNQDPCADPGFCQCGRMMNLAPDAAMAQMARPFNNIMFPTAPLGICAKDRLCKMNPKDMRCSPNPMGSMFGRSMNRGPMMGGRGPQRNNMAPSHAHTEPQYPTPAPPTWGRSTAQYWSRTPSPSNWGRSPAPSSWGMSPATSTNWGRSPSPSSWGMSPATSSNWGRSPAPSSWGMSHATSSNWAPAQPAAPVRSAAPVQSAAPASTQNDLMMQTLMTMFMSNPAMQAFVKNPNFTKTFSSIMQKELNPQQNTGQFQSAAPQQTMQQQPPQQQVHQFPVQQPAQTMFNPFAAFG